MPEYSILNRYYIATHCNVCLSARANKSNQYKLKGLKRSILLAVLTQGVFAEFNFLKSNSKIQSNCVDNVIFFDYPILYYYSIMHL